MGLTCSLLGHAFEDTDVERDREEQGSEVVTIVREVETCRRCGETRTVSENKEVTAIVEPDDVGASEGESAALGSMAEAADDDATSDDGAVADNPSAGEHDEFAGADADAEFEPPDDPAEEDAEILDDDRETPREPGQWPDDEDDFEPTTLTGDRAETAPDGSDVVADAEGDEPDADVTEDVTADDDDDSASPEPAATSVPTGDYVCPECGFTTPAAESSLREGDSCPECRRGYLTAQ